MNQLRSEVHEVLGNRNLTDEKFQAVVLDEIAGLKVRGTREGVLHGTEACHLCVHVCVYVYVCVRMCMCTCVCVCVWAAPSAGWA